MGLQHKRKDDLGVQVMGLKDALAGVVMELWVADTVSQEIF